MKTSYNSTDGFYFFILLISFALSLWFGDLLRIRIQSTKWNQKLSIFIGTFVEILVTSVGLFIGFLLVKILTTYT